MERLIEFKYIPVEEKSVTEKRNRWIVILVCVFGLLAFLVPSVAQVIPTFFPADPSSSATNSPSPIASASPSAQKAELEAQAKGYELVLQREPDNQTALKELLKIRLALNDIKGAIAPLEKLTKANPNETFYAVLLAQSQQQTGDQEAAAQTYRDVLKINPGDVSVLSGLVGLLMKEQRPEAAISLLQDTLKNAAQTNQVQPNSVDVPTIQILLADIYVNQKRYDEAIAIYTDIEKANKNDFRPALGKAMLLKQQGNMAEAKPLFTKAAELAPAKYKDQINQMAVNPLPGAAPAASSSPALPTASPGNSATPNSTPSGKK